MSEIVIPEEVWKSIEGFEGIYEVSNLGRVRSLDRRTQGRDGIYQRRRGFMLRFTHPKGKYPTLNLKHNGKHVVTTVHKLVLNAFRGKCPRGLECCHFDGNPLNNRLDNLRWDTPQSNSDDKKRIGTQPVGERVYIAKLTEAKVREIHSLMASGVALAEIGKHYGVARGTISSINQGQTWKHLRLPWINVRKNVHARQKRNSAGQFA